MRERMPMHQIVGIESAIVAFPSCIEFAVAFWAEIAFCTQRRPFGNEINDLLIAHTGPPLVF